MGGLHLSFDHFPLFFNTTTYWFYASNAAEPFLVTKTHILKDRAAARTHTTKLLVAFSPLLHDSAHQSHFPPFSSPPINQINHLTSPDTHTHTLTPTHTPVSVCVWSAVIRLNLSALPFSSVCLIIQSPSSKTPHMRWLGCPGNPVPALWYTDLQPRSSAQRKTVARQTARSELTPPLAAGNAGCCSICEVS